MRSSALLAVALLLAGCGGGAAAPAPRNPPVTKGPLGDTWTWSGSAWQRVAGPAPPARYSSAMAYDAATGQLLLYGGALILDQYADTWSFDGRAWTQLHPAHSPGKLAGEAMAYDAEHQQVVLWGGDRGGAESGESFTDTWTWDGQDWTLRSRDGPGARDGFSLAYDPGLGGVVLFGGSSANTNYRDETWAWDGAAWARLELTPRPTPRYGAGLAPDGGGGLLLFGGAILKPDAGPGEAGLPVGDTWRFKGGAWSQLNPTASAPSRADTAMALDPISGHPLLFSGFECPFKADTWSFDGSAWKQVSATGPQPRSYAAIAAGKTVVLFGGLADTPCL